MLDGDHRVSGHGVADGEGERVLHDGPVERAPDVDDAVAALEQGVRLVGEVVAHALGGRLGRLVDVHAVDGAALGVGGRAPDGVVEDEDPLGAQLVPQELLDFRVVVLLDARVVGEGCFGRGRDAVQGEARGVGAEVGLPAAGVVHRHLC